MNRRQLLQGSAMLPTLLLGPQQGRAAVRSSDAAFGPSSVRELARALAGKAYEAPDEKLPNALKDMNYDQYRSIRFLPERALWRGQKLPFEAQFFHRGFFYKNRVEIFEVADGQVREVGYRKADFSFGEKVSAFNETDLGFAGFRIHAPMNKPDYYSSSVRVTSGRLPRDKHTACPPAAFRSTQGKPRARNFPPSNPSGSSGLRQMRRR